jgi:hypothetical protein
MTLSDFLLFSVAAIGFTHIMVDSVIMQPLRDWIMTRAQNTTGKTQWFWGKITKILSCYQCAGFWCGLLAGAILVSINILVIFMCGCATSFLALTAAHFIQYLEANSVIVLPTRPIQANQETSQGDQENGN